jgi:hypothetical protein
LNPRLQVELWELAGLREQLSRRKAAPLIPGRVVRRRQGSVLAAVTSVIEQAERPLRVREVHAAVEELLGARVPFSSVNEALSTHAGPEERFCRLRYGVYENARRAASSGLLLRPGRDEPRWTSELLRAMIVRHGA